MSSLTQGVLRGYTGVILATTGGPAVTYFRAMGISADGRLCVGAVSDLNFNGSVNVDDDGLVAISYVAPIHNYAGGLPLSIDGELCVENEYPVTFTQGVGLTPSGRVSLSDQLYNNFAILQEDGFDLLLEDGSRLLQEN